MLNEILSWIGAVSLLTGLGLASFERTRECRRCIGAINFVGGLALAWSAAAASDYSIAVLNGAWCAIILASVARRLRRRQRHLCATFTGGAGCGKTTVVSAVGKALELRGTSVRRYYSGQTWRELALAMRREGVDLAKEEECVDWWDKQRPSLNSLGSLQMRTGKPQGSGLEGEAVGALARTIASHANLRARVVDMMRAHVYDSASAEVTLIDARDGVVLSEGLPALHFYISVPIEVRAERRANQTGQDRQAIRAMITARDQGDTNFGRLTEVEARHSPAFVVIDGCRPLEVIVAEVIERLQIGSIRNQRA